MGFFYFMLYWFDSYIDFQFHCSYIEFDFHWFSKMPCSGKVVSRVFISFNLSNAKNLYYIDESIHMHEMCKTWMKFHFKSFFSTFIQNRAIPSQGFVAIQWFHPKKKEESIIKHFLRFYHSWNKLERCTSPFLHSPKLSW